MYRTYVISRHTFFESVVQPIYALMIALGAAVLIVFALLPFFTLGEDTNMFKLVGLDVILLAVLIATLFATSKSIFEEIEDRTMLTLMSKPVRRAEVIIGKYLGIAAAALLAVAILGLVIILCTWWRIPTDHMLRPESLDTGELKRLSDLRWMSIAGLVPALVLLWMQVGVLAAVGVALSTRFSLVVNLPVVILIYLAGNLTRFLFPMTGPGGSLEDRNILVRGVAYVLAHLLPVLEVFDVRNLAILRPLALQGTTYADQLQATSVWGLWGYVGLATLYAIAYATFALAVGLWLFQTRDLSGNEG